MIKIIISITKIVVTAILALLFASCQFNTRGITGSGNVTTQTRNVGNFTGVESKSGLEVVVIQADAISVVVEADDNLQDHIITKVENGILKVSCEYNSFTDVSAKKITVKMPIISSLESSGGSELNSVTVLTSDALSLKSSSGSSLHVEVEADKLTSEASSGSTLEVSGKALTFDTTSSSGSSVEAQSLLANDITAQSSSGSSIDVHPIVSLDAKASSGSSINYNMEPKSIKISESSGGSVGKN